MHPNNLGMQLRMLHRIILPLFSAICLLLLCAVQNVMAQDDPITNGFELPPAPTAASLGRYGDIPVSLYTGTPNISVPIYEYKSRDISVPISLSYHAGGVRVQDQASWVGSGWSLNAGGVITRTLRGKADEMINGFISLTSQEKSQLAAIMDGTSTMNGEQRRNFFDGIVNGDMDSQPDIFNFNFMGYTGKFLFDMDGNIHLTTAQKLKIEPIYGSSQSGGYQVFNGFIITTPNGMIYEFNEEESTSMGLSRCSGSNGLAVPSPNFYHSAWHLTRIVSPRGQNEVNFTYTSDLITYDVNISETKQYYRNGNLKGSSRCAVYVSAGVKRLTRIDGALGYVSFVPDSQPRQDLKGGKRLKYVEVFDGTNLDPVKRYTLEYFYTENRRLDGFSGWNDELLPYYQKRLFLMQVKEGMDPCTDNVGYAFNYDNPSELPPRYSCAIDYWGYYNGRDDNTSLVPKMHVQISWFDVQLNEETRTLGYAERKPNGYYARKGVLNKITYPTGGHTLFEFEPNDAYSRDLPPTTQGEDFDIDFYYALRQAGGSGSGGQQTDPVSFVHSATGSTGAPMLGDVTTIVSFEEPTIVTMQPIFEIAEPGKMLDKGDVPRHFLQFKDLATGENLIAYTATPSYSAGRTDLPPVTRTLHGDYEFKGMVNPYFHGDKVRIIFTYDPPSGAGLNGIKRKIVGGIRLKRMEHVDLVDPTKSIIREYDYTIHEAGEHRSSGEFGQLPIFHHLMLPAQSGTDFIVMGANMSTILHSDGGYRRVTVTEPGNGRSVHHFLNILDAPFAEAYFERYGGAEYPFPPLQTIDWGIGKEKQVEHFREGDNLPFRTVKYNYEFTEFDPDFYGLKIGAYGSREGSASGYKIEPYKVLTRWARLDNVVERNFDNGLDPEEYLEQVTYYMYNNDNLQVQRSETTGSDGAILRTSYRYPVDLAGTDAIAAGMASAHIHSPVLEQKQTIIENGTEKLLAKVHNQYAQYQLGKYAIKRMDALETDAPLTDLNANNLVTKMTVFDYDDYGNPLSLEKEDGLRVAMEWGAAYNHTVPTRQIVNSNGPVADQRSTTFTHQPLIGVASQTDANGLTTSYAYDAFGRLDEVRDHENNILQAYEYVTPDLPCYLQLSLSGPSQVMEGAPVTITADASDGYGGYTYRWWEDGIFLLGTNSQSISRFPTAGTHTYRCEVTDASGYAITADLIVTVNTPNFIQVMTPSTASVWQMGTTKQILWDWQESGASAVAIKLFKGGVQESIITNSTAIGNQSYSWTIPTSLTPGDDYQIQLTSNGSQTDMSEVFQIIAAAPPPPPTLSVNITVNAGQLVANVSGTCSSYTINWTGIRQDGTTTNLGTAGSIAMPFCEPGHTNCITQVRCRATGCSQVSERTFTIPN
ncbi:MAG: Ser-Thr-rich GPI-anchored membrane family protein [Bacteroidota bacterium]